MMPFHSVSPSSICSRHTTSAPHSLWRGCQTSLPIPFVPVIKNAFPSIEQSVQRKMDAIHTRPCRFGIGEEDRFAFEIDIAEVFAATRRSWQGPSRGIVNTLKDPLNCYLGERIGSRSKLRGQSFPFYVHPGRHRTLMLPRVVSELHLLAFSAVLRGGLRGIASSGSLSYFDGGHGA